MADWLDCCIDVSHNNGAIDWPNLDPAIELAFVKATQGSGFVDPLFAANKAGALAAGRLVVPYHFLDASDPDAQIANFGQFIDPGQPYALDWEGRTTATAANVEYIGAVLGAKIGRTPVGYWGIPGSSPAAPTPAMTRWTAWRPRYPIANAQDFSAIPDDKRALIDAPFWQYTQWGRVAGVNGDVDRSVWGGTLADLRAWYGASPPAGAQDAPQAPGAATTLPADPQSAPAASAASPMAIPIPSARDMQTTLAAEGLYPPGEIDGKWGPKSQAALDEHMRKAGG